jgi:transposase
VDCRGLEVGKAVSFKNDRPGFEKIVARIEAICKQNVRRERYGNVTIGMEPTGHYWKALASYLIKAGYRVFGVNPYHTKKSKELDDNSPTKNDAKDALTIARLVKDGRYFNPLGAEGALAEIRKAGYNLVEDSSGKSKRGTRISKRGRKQLRSALYQMAFTMAGQNAEMKLLYKHLTAREKNPLKKKTGPRGGFQENHHGNIYALLKKHDSYKPELVFGAVRKEMLSAA